MVSDDCYDWFERTRLDLLAWRTNFVSNEHDNRREKLILCKRKNCFIIDTLYIWVTLNFPFIKNIWIIHRETLNEKQFDWKIITEIRILIILWIHFHVYVIHVCKLKRPNGICIFVNQSNVSGVFLNSFIQWKDHDYMLEILEYFYCFNSCKIYTRQSVAHTVNLNFGTGFWACQLTFLYP